MREEDSWGEKGALKRSEQTSERLGGGAYGSDPGFSCIFCAQVSSSSATSAGTCLHQKKGPAYLHHSPSPCQLVSSHTQQSVRSCT